jgi:Pentapeptide repeats (9 copies)
LAKNEYTIEQLDAMSHLNRLRLGKDIWQQWNQGPRPNGLDPWPTSTPINFAQCLEEEDAAPNSDGRYAFEMDNLEHFQFVGPVSFKNIRFINKVDFSNCKFYENVDFTRTIFSNEANFFKAEFHKRARFIKTEFAESALFDEANFRASATFDSARFRGLAQFIKTQFSGPTRFQRVKFFDAAAFHEAKFTSHATFSYCIFWEEAGFGKVEFGDNADFSQVIVCNDADYTGVKFGGPASFEESIFANFASFEKVYALKKISFHGSSFMSSSFFDSAVFHGPVDLDNCSFGITEQELIKEFIDEKELPDSFIQKLNTSASKVSNELIPDFRFAQFKLAPNLSFTSILIDPDPMKNEIIKYATRLDLYDNAASKLRRLKQLAAEGHNHERENYFFRLELLTSRKSENRNLFEIMFIDSYELFSKCGQSVGRALAWWASTWVLFSALFALIAKSSAFAHALYFSLLNSLPFLGVVKALKSESAYQLFGETMPVSVSYLSVGQNMFSTLFLFLALLALRNKFKLR